VKDSYLLQVCKLVSLNIFNMALFIP